MKNFSVSLLIITILLFLPGTALAVETKLPAADNRMLITYDENGNRQSMSLKEAREKAQKEKEQKERETPASAPAGGEQWSIDKGFIKTGKDGKPLSTDGKPARFGAKEDDQKQAAARGVLDSPPTEVAQGDTPLSAAPSTKSEVGGAVTRPQYDAEGNNIGFTKEHYDGSGSLTKTEYYDKGGNLTVTESTVTENGETFTKIEYHGIDVGTMYTHYKDSNGKLVKAAAHRGDSSVSDVFHYQRNVAGNRLYKREKVDKEGKVTQRTSYDKNQNRTATEFLDKDGKVTKRAEYDQDGNCIKIEHLDKDSSVSHTEEWDGKTPLDPDKTPLENELFRKGLLKEKPSNPQPPPKPAPPAGYTYGQTGYTYGRQNYTYHGPSSTSAKQTPKYPPGYNPYANVVVQDVLALPPIPHQESYAASKTGSSTPAKSAPAQTASEPPKQEAPKPEPKETQTTPAASQDTSLKPSTSCPCGRPGCTGCS